MHHHPASLILIALTLSPGACVAMVDDPGSDPTAIGADGDTTCEGGPPSADELCDDPADVGMTHPGCFAAPESISCTNVRYVCHRAGDDYRWDVLDCGCSCAEAPAPENVDYDPEGCTTWESTIYTDVTPQTTCQPVTGACSQFQNVVWNPNTEQCVLEDVYKFCRTATYSGVQFCGSGPDGGWGQCNSPSENFRAAAQSACPIGEEDDEEDYTPVPSNDVATGPFDDCSCAAIALDTWSDDDPENDSQFCATCIGVSCESDADWSAGWEATRDRCVP